MSEKESSAYSEGEGELRIAFRQPTPPTHREQLDLALQIYSACLRDYFSTFGTYTTATSILVAALSFLTQDKPDNKSSPLVLLVSICGLILCWQWYISTASMRNQVAHFKSRIQELERAVGLRLLSRWLSVSRMASGIQPPENLSSEEKSVTEKDSEWVNWTFRFLGGPLGLRGAMLPVIYAAIFLGVGFSFLPGAEVGWDKWLAFAVAILWLIVVPIGIHKSRENRRKNLGGKPARKAASSVSLLDREDQEDEAGHQQRVTKVRSTFALRSTWGGALLLILLSGLAGWLAGKPPDE